MSLASGAGVTANIPNGTHLFAELPGLVIVGTSNPEKIQKIASDFGITAELLGVISIGGHLELKTEGKTICWQRDALNGAFEGTFARLLK